VSGTLGAGDVSVLNAGAMNAGRAARITISSTDDVIADNATLSLAGGGAANTADDGFASLSTGVNETVGRLILGGSTQTLAGTYGSTSSAATYQFDEYFSGSGVINLVPVTEADGDFDADGDVDGADFLDWQRGFGTTADALLSDGDADGDHDVDADDLAVWAGHFGDPAETAAVPEPGAGAAFVLAAAGLGLACRRGRVAALRKSCDDTRQHSLADTWGRHGSRQFGRAAVLTGVMVLAGAGVGHAEPYFVGLVDPIGPDDSTTSGVGATRPAVQGGVANIGRPGVVFPQNGHELLQELRVIVWSLPVPSPNHVDFTQYNYVLKLWHSANYFAGALPATTLSIPHPYNVTYITHPGDGWVTPDVVFGVTNMGAPTYDLRFDLSSVSHFATPLAAGDWVMTLQSVHSQVSWGQLRVLTAFGPGVQGLLSVYSQDGPPAIAQGYTYSPPGDAFLAMSLTATAVADGDFNADGDVDGRDFLAWQRGLGTTGALLGDGDADGDHDVDASDLAMWVDHFGEPPAAAPVPEPHTAMAAILAAVAMAIQLVRFRPAPLEAAIDVAS
jgi:hypothetical protein